MNLFWERGQIEDVLSAAFQDRYGYQDVALTGILFARPEDSLTREDILPHLDYWNWRSGEWVDFFCVGYIPRWYADSTGGLPPVLTVGEGEWTFARSAFVKLLAEIEVMANVRSDGSPCLLLLNSYFDGHQARLDYTRTIWINFREALKDEAISTPTQLAEHVFEFAEHTNGRGRSLQDPVWEISDSLGRRVLKRSAVDALLAFLPEWARPGARRATHFAVHRP